MKIKTVIL